MNVSATEELVENVLGTRFNWFDDVIIEQAKTRIIDSIGCLIAGVNAPGNSALVNLVKRWGGRKQATILVHGIRAQAQNVAMVNCIMARSYDYEPNGALVNGKIIPSHISGTTIMTAITMSEMMGANGQELITAMLVGENIASRILAAGSSTKRVDSIGTVNVFGATAIAGRLMRLNKSQMLNALGICLDQISGSYQNVWDGTGSFKLSQGLSARSGIFSAELARQGWSASKDPLLGKFGYFYLYSDGVTSSDVLTRDLGEKYYTEAHFKPYISCRYNHGPLECVFSLLHKHQIEAENIKEVNISVSRKSLQATVGKPFEGGDSPYAAALFSFQYTVANALLRKCIKPEHFSEELINDPDINVLVNKIKLSELPQAELLEANVNIVMNDGEEFSEYCDAPRGDQDKNPMSKDEIIAKFWANVESSRILKKENAEEVIRLVENIEKLDSLDRVIQLLVSDIMNTASKL